MSINDVNLEVFEVLVKQNYQKVYQTVYAYTIDKYITEDAVQQAFVIAFKQLNKLKFKDKFASWVITIALNEAKRMLRDKNNIKLKSMTDMSITIDNDIELKEDVCQTLNRLKRQDAEILILKYYADLTLQQISDILGINISNAKVKLHRAKEKFRELTENKLEA